MSEAEAVLVFTSCPDEATAEALATRLVEARLAACVNIVPGVKSIYRWQGKLQADAEVLLLIKATRASTRVIAENISAWHPYELPECVAVPIEHGLPDYLAWLNAQVSTDETTD